MEFENLCLCFLCITENAVFFIPQHHLESSCVIIQFADCYVYVDVGL